MHRSVTPTCSVSRLKPDVGRFQQETEGPGLRGECNGVFHRVGLGPIWSRILCVV